jgi:hypothetical protein
MFQKFGIMMKMENNIDIMLTFLFHLKIDVLKLNQLGQQKRRKIIFILKKKQEKKWVTNMIYGYLTKKVIFIVS